MSFSSKSYHFLQLAYPFLVLAFLFLISVSYRNTGTGTLIVKVSNINQLKGQVYVAVFNQSNGFPDDTAKMLRKTFYDVKAKTLVCKVKNVPYGKVALSIFHDINSNGSLDKGWFGIPQEPFGFSTNYTPIISAPDFDDCFINFANNEQTENIKLID